MEINLKDMGFYHVSDIKTIQKAIDMCKKSIIDDSSYYREQIYRFMYKVYFNQSFENPSIEEVKLRYKNKLSKFICDNNNTINLEFLNWFIFGKTSVIPINIDNYTTEFLFLYLIFTNSRINLRCCLPVCMNLIGNDSYDTNAFIELSDITEIENDYEDCEGTEDKIIFCKHKIEELESKLYKNLRKLTIDRINKCNHKFGNVEIVMDRTDDYNESNQEFGTELEDIREWKITINTKIEKKECVKCGLVMEKTSKNGVIIDDWDYEYKYFNSQIDKTKNKFNIRSKYEVIRI